jgi:hypothetical protein
MLRRIHFTVAVIIIASTTSPVLAQTDTGTLCVRVYDDRNANGFFDSGEGFVDGAIVSLSSPELTHPATYTTGITDRPECVDALLPGLFGVSVRPPDGSMPTSPADLQIQVNAGEKVTVEVGLAVLISAEPASVCVSVYSDLDGNGMLDEGEEPMEGGKIALVDVNASNAVGDYVTNGGEPFCFEDVPQSRYRVSVTLPGEWTPTTKQEWEFPLAAGSTIHLEFGARLETSEGSEFQVSHPYADSQFWLTVILVIGMVATPLIGFASLILNIIILRRLGKLLKAKADS